jgi:pantoate--beta-alanine ligase
LYPSGHATRVIVGGLGDVLEGASRPGHFAGVATVVLKLINVVQPDVLWLGQKDAQQAILIERMCRDLDLPVKVRRAPTMRESDGLARSSRNSYLSEPERAEAVALVRGLRAARAALNGGARTASQVRAAVRRVWKDHPKVREDYVEVVDARTLAPLGALRGHRHILVAVAARLGKTRLIDNLEWSR